MRAPSLSLESLARLHGEELQNISHALRTPLTSIVGFADAMLSDSSLAGEQREEFTRIIKAEGEKLAKFVDELLHVSFAAQDSSAERIYDLGSVLSCAFHAVSVPAAARSIVIHHNLAPECSRARLDGRFVSRMLRNILDNVIWYAPNESEIAVTGIVKGPEVQITVAGRRKLRVSGKPGFGFHFGLDRTRYLLTMNGGSLRIHQSSAEEISITMYLPLGA